MDWVFELQAALRLQNSRVKKGLPEPLFRVAQGRKN
ncbi:MAG: hypothetical protein ACI9LD_000806 [Polaromonas sp.]|jgi:hypothetical protein